MRLRLLPLPMLLLLLMMMITLSLLSYNKIKVSSVDVAADASAGADAAVTEALCQWPLLPTRNASGQPVAWHQSILDIKTTREPSYIFDKQTHAHTHRVTHAYSNHIAHTHCCSEIIFITYILTFSIFSSSSCR